MVVNHVNNMSYLDKQIMYNTMTLYDYLSIYGVDKNNTKEDLILLSLIKEIFNLENNYYLLTDKSFNMLISKEKYIMNNNPDLRYFRCGKDCSNDFLPLALSIIVTEDSHYGFIGENGAEWIVVE